jgi:glutamyl-tRNA synthetase
MVCKARFAPSPTGFLHVGNARVAIVNYLFAKKNNGSFLLRIDDTDLIRSQKKYEDSIFEDLFWLGIKYDNSFKQSEKVEHYKEILNQLIKNETVYKCYETPEELEYKRKMALLKGLPPVYDRASLHLSSVEKQKLETEGIQYYWRFRLPNETISWNDIILGEISYDLQHISDPVIMKADGTFLYTFTSVIDDLDSGISHIIRGQDHVTNTAAQIAMFKAMAGGIPQFAHLSLFVNKDGSQFSKRLGSMNLGDIRKKGVDPMAVTNLLATLGSSLDPIPFLSMDELVNYFDITKFSTNSPKFDINNIMLLNKKILRQKLHRDIKGLTISQAAFDVIKKNIENYQDIKVWEKILSTDFISSASFSEAEKDLLNIVIKEAKETPVEALLKNVKNKTNLSGKDLYTPIRMALTGQEHGPNLEELCTILGKEEIERRIKWCLLNGD